MSLAGACILGQAVSGTKVARARFRRRCGTWEPLAAMWPAVVLTGVGVKGRPPSSGHCEGLSTDARQGGGPPRSSEEAPVIRVERRGRVVLILFGGQPEFPGGAR
jgi:hypothetical protein